MNQRYPLQWPVGWKRTARPTYSKFKTPNLGLAIQNLLTEVRRMPGQISDIIISSNVPLRNDGLPRADYQRSTIIDKGVAIYFKIDKEDTVMACDKWDTVEDNLHALYLSIEALRGVDRWGVSDFLKRSFTGFTALPAPIEAAWWWKILGFEREPSRDPVNGMNAETRYKDLAKIHHPDKGGDPAKFAELTEAWGVAKKYWNI